MFESSNRIIQIVHVRAYILKSNKSHTNRVIQIVSCKTTVKSFAVFTGKYLWWIY